MKTSLKSHPLNRSYSNKWRKKIQWWLLKNTLKIVLKKKQKYHEMRGRSNDLFTTLMTIAGETQIPPKLATFSQDLSCFHFFLNILHKNNKKKIPKWKRKMEKMNGFSVIKIHENTWEVEKKNHFIVRN